jgi:PhnB protein
MSTISFSHPYWFANVEQRPHPWPGLNWLTAMLIVPDVKQAMVFYEKVFGIVPIFESPGQDGDIIFARMRYRGCNFTLNRQGEFNYNGKAPITAGNLPPFIFYLYVDNVDQVFADAISNGCQSLQEPHPEFWGDKKARLVDPFGYIWEIAMKVV